MKNRKPAATGVIIAICILVQLAIHFFNISTDTETAILFGAYYKSFVMAGEYWRVLTCGFVHVSVWHLFMNCMALLNIGPAFENRYGVVRYLIILLGSVIGGSMFTYCMQGNIVAVGLSGGIYGLMGGYIMLVIMMGTWKNPQVLSELIRIILINVLINFIPGIAVSAHLGGFLTGMLLTGILTGGERKFRIRMGVCTLVMCVLLGFSAVRNSTIRVDQVYLLSDYRVLSAEKNMGFSEHAYHMAQNLDKIYDTGGYLELMLEAGYDDEA